MPQLFRYFDFGMYICREDHCVLLSNKEEAGLSRVNRYWALLMVWVFCFPLIIISTFGLFTGNWGLDFSGSEQTAIMLFFVLLQAWATVVFCSGGLTIPRLVFEISGGYFSWFYTGIPLYKRKIKINIDTEILVHPSMEGGYLIAFKNGGKLQLSPLRVEEEAAAKRCVRFLQVQFRQIDYLPLMLEEETDQFEQEEKAEEALDQLIFMKDANPNLIFEDSLRMLFFFYSSFLFPLIYFTIGLVSQQLYFKPVFFALLLPLQLFSALGLLVYWSRPIFKNAWRMRTIVTAREIVTNRAFLPFIKADQISTTKIAALLSQPTEEGSQHKIIAVMQDGERRDTQIRLADAELSKQLDKIKQLIEIE